jgi:hypothetical protein
MVGSSLEQGKGMGKARLPLVSNQIPQRCT